MPSDKTNQIQRRKELLDSSRASAYEFERLERQCRKAAEQGHELDIFAIRAISKTEVFTRRWIREVVNHSHDYAVRAISLIQNTKPDYELVLSTSRNLITFGDLVAHTVSISTLEHIFGIFQTLCGCKFETVLPSVIDRWDVEIHSLANEPIIGNYKEACANIAALFNTRHVICHEAPEVRQLDLSKLVVQLHSLTEFLSALDWYLIGMLHGNIPLTQTDMNMSAIEKCEKVNEELNDVLTLLRSSLSDDPRQLKLLNVTQAAWQRFKHLQSCFRHDPQGGGSIGPMLRAAEAEKLTKERLEHLLSYVNRKEGEM